MQKYQTEHYRVYLMSFQKDGVSYLKPGFTQYKDVYSRIEANHLLDQKEHPNNVTWKDYFDRVNPAKSITVKGKAQAKLIEQEILDALGKKDVSFDVKFSGITEMRSYSNRSYAIACTILEKYRTVWQ